MKFCERKTIFFECLYYNDNDSDSHVFWRSENIISESSRSNCCYVFWYEHFRRIRFVTCVRFARISENRTAVSRSRISFRWWPCLEFAKESPDNCTAELIWLKRIRRSRLEVKTATYHPLHVILALVERFFFKIQRSANSSSFKPPLLTFVACITDFALCRESNGQILFSIRATDKNLIENDAHRMRRMVRKNIYKCWSMPISIDKMECSNYIISGHLRWFTVWMYPTVSLYLSLFLSVCVFATNFLLLLSKRLSCSRYARARVCVCKVLRLLLCCCWLIFRCYRGIEWNYE